MRTHRKCQIAVQLRTRPATPQVLLDLPVAKRRPGQPTHDNERPVTPADDYLVKRLAKTILGRAVDIGLSRKDLAKEAGRKSPSTIEAYASGVRKRPSLLDLNDFAVAAKLRLVLIPNDVALGPDTTLLHVCAPGGPMDDLTKRLLRYWPKLDRIQKALVVGRVEQMADAAESADENPPQPGAEKGRGRDRSNSPGQTVK